MYTIYTSTLGLKTALPQRDPTPCYRPPPSLFLKGPSHPPIRSPFCKLLTVMKWLFQTPDLLWPMLQNFFGTQSTAFAFPTGSTASRAQQPERSMFAFLRFYFHPPGPFSSPEGYIWDPNRRRWIPNRSGDGLLGLVLGILVTLGLLSLLGYL